MNPLDCVDIDECKGNNTCTQTCVNTKGSYACRCLDDYENNVIVGAMAGKDCRAKGDAAKILIASDDQIVQLALSGGNSSSGGRTNRNGVAYAQHHDSDVAAIEFDPRRELMFWIDSVDKRIYRSALASGNQSHLGQQLKIDLNALELSPLALAIDYLTGNLYVATVGGNALDIDSTHLEKSTTLRRRRRMSEPQALDSGAILLTTSDGRYVKRLIGGQLQIPTAIVTLPQLGRICYADAGLQAKIECADMDGNARSVRRSFYFFLSFLKGWDLVFKLFHWRYVF